MASAVGNHDFEIPRGADWERVLTVRIDGALWNFTGYTAEMDIRESDDSPSELLTLTTGNSRIVLGGTAGTITLTLTKAVTAALTFNRAVYSLHVISGAAVTTPLLKGRIIAPLLATR